MSAFPQPHKCAACNASENDTFGEWSVRERAWYCERCYDDLPTVVAVDTPAPSSNGTAPTGALGLLVDMVDAVARAEEPFDFPAYPIAARGFVTVLAGRHSSFKSWITLGVAHAVHAGRKEIAGVPCRKGVALYVDAENGPRLMGRRFRAAGIPPDGLLVADGFQLRLPGSAPALRALIEATGATLVVLDSLRRLAPGARENESDDMAPLFAVFASIARDLDVAIVVIHHQSTKANAPASRGSSAIEDQTDLMFTLGRAAGDPDPERRKLAVEKFRIDEDPDPLWIRLGRVGELVTIDAAEPHEQEGRTPVKRAALEDNAVEIVTRAGRGMRRPEIAAALGLKSRDTTLRRALDNAVEARRLTLDDDLYTAPSRVPRGQMAPSGTPSGQGVPPPLLRRRR